MKRLWSPLLFERENKKYFVARIITETERHNLADWQVFERAGSEISIKQTFENIYFMPLEAGGDVARKG